jgi:hypothetical protein
MKTRRMLHRELWFWLAENPRKYKHEWPGWEKHDTWENDIRSYAPQCYACGEAHKRMRRQGGDTYCTCCPVDWGACECMRSDTIYEAWKFETNLELRSIMAEAIACAWPK